MSSFNLSVEDPPFTRDSMWRTIGDSVADLRRQVSELQWQRTSSQLTETKVKRRATALWNEVWRLLYYVSREREGKGGERAAKAYKSLTGLIVMLRFHVGCLQAPPQRQSSSLSSRQITPRKLGRGARTGTSSKPSLDSFMVVVSSNRRDVLYGAWIDEQLVEALWKTVNPEIVDVLPDAFSLVEGLGVTEKDAQVLLKGEHPELWWSSLCSGARVSSIGELFEQEKNLVSDIKWSSRYCSPSGSFVIYYRFLHDYRCRSNTAYDQVLVKRTSYFQSSADSLVPPRQEGLDVYLSISRSHLSVGELSLPSQKKHGWDKPYETASQVA